MKKLVLSAVICSALLSPSLVLAQDYHHSGPSSSHHGAPHGPQGFHDRGVREGWYRKGGHVPTAYRGNTYVVNDYRTYHLKKPRRGYHWVRSDNGDFLLVAAATGVIASIVANALH